MIPRWSRLVGVILAALVVVLPASLAGAAGPSHGDPLERADAVASHTVTLVTGDVVRVTTIGDRTTASVDPAPTSAGGVQTLTIGDDLYVIPHEALPYLAAGRLDRELLNVTRLIDQGYDDESSDVLPLIAQFGSSVDTAAGRAAPAGASKKRDLASINGAAITAGRRNKGLFWVSVAPQRPPGAPLSARFTNGITKLWLDRKLEASLADSVPQVGAPAAWEAGFDGTGATVAVLDTGVDATHPDLVDAVVEAETFVPGEAAGEDQNGHGTHVASTIAGSGAASDGAYRGVAPGADLVVGKVLDSSGFGQSSWIIDGMEWAVERADVVNMSLGDPEYTDGLDPLSQAVNTLTEEEGVLFVVAAGNSGSEFAVSSPGAADAALTVAAVDGADERAWFSSMGPRTGDHALKPDLAAPGVDVTAARSQQIPYGEGWYQPLDGTSMATPHVAGAAAIVAGKHPTWTAGRLKDALMSSSAPLAGKTPYEVGTGRLDIPAALDDVHATGSAFFGFYAWPHDGDESVSRTVTYTNAGDAPVTLELDDAVTGPGGEADLLELSASTVTVPAGGSTQVELSADPDDAEAVGRYTGFVVATDSAGVVRARTAVGLVKEEERYDLDVTVLDRAGQPGSGYVTLFDFRSPWPTFLSLDPATGKARTQRLAPGPYNVSTWLEVTGASGAGSKGVALLAEPHYVLDGDGQVVLDARKANRVSASTPRASEDRYRRMQYFHDAGIADGFTYADLYFARPDVDDLFAAPTGPVPGAAFDFAMRWRRSAPLLELAARTPARSDFDPLYQGGSARLDGKVRLDAVYAGTGTPDEYEGVKAKGKAVLITRSDAVSSWDWVAPAQEAGAALLVVVNDRPGKLYDFVFGDVPVVSVTKEQGEPLIAAARAGKLSFSGSASAFSEYMYDLVLADDRGIPADLSIAPRAAELARVDHRFLGPPGVVYEARSDCYEHSLPPCWGSYEPASAQSTRVDYVTPGVRWYQEVFHAGGWEQRHEQTTFARGQRASIDWLLPVTRPRLGPGFWGPERSGDFMAVNVPTSSSGGRITGAMLDEGSTVVSRLYLGDQLLAEQPFQAVFAEAAPDLATYRFEQEVTRPELWRTSLRTRSSWTFVSGHVGGDEVRRLPLLQLDYGVATDLTSSVDASKPGTIRVSAAHEPGVLDGGVVQGVTLELSYDDGSTWTRVPLLAEKGGAWRARVDYPRKARFVSIRATAQDDAGNRVEQEIVRAYALR